MMSATCDGPDDCWFGGIGSQDPLGRTGRGVPPPLERDRPADLLRAPGAGRSARCSSTTVSCSRATLVGRSPEDRTDPVELGGTRAGAAPDPPGRRPGLRKRPLRAGTARRRARSTGPSCWPSTATAPISGRSAAERRRGRRRRSDGAVARPPVAAQSRRRLLPAGRPERCRAFGPTDRFTDVAAIPGTDEALATVVPFADRRSVNSKATVARIAADGTTTTTRLPVAGAGRGSAAQVACPAHERLLDGHLGRLALPLQRRDAARSRHRPRLRRARSSSGRTSRRNSSSPIGSPSTTLSSSRRRHSS